jgi:hypothetical protein
MMRIPRVVRAVLLLGVVAKAGIGQNLNFQEAERRIVRLPPTAFPMLPIAVIGELQRRGCTIPQEVFSKTPNNVISGQFARRWQKDWAVLCSVHGASSILVFWSGSGSNPSAIAPSADMNFLQGMGGDKIGFSRGISAVGRDFITRHYQAYGGTKPPPIDHQGINDAFLEKASVVQYFFDGKWMQLTGAD